jgi:hypothetical protein
MKRILAGIMLTIALSGVAQAATATRTRTVYRTDDGARLVIVGQGCFSQEDVTTLKLVEYDGPQRLVYRCVRP